MSLTRGVLKGEINVGIRVRSPLVPAPQSAVIRGVTDTSVGTVDNIIPSKSLHTIREEPSTEHIGVVSLTVILLKAKGWEKMLTETTARQITMRIKRSTYKRVETRRIAKCQSR